MDVRLRKLRGEKSDGGLWSRNGQTSVSRSLHLINVEVGTGNSEVISIGDSEKFVRLGNMEAKKLNRVGGIH